MFCSNCGAALPDGSRFCGKCGNPIAAAPPTPPQNTEPPHSENPNQFNNEATSTQGYIDPSQTFSAGYGSQQDAPDAAYGNPGANYGAQQAYPDADYAQQAYPNVAYGDPNMPNYPDFVPEAPKKKHIGRKIALSVVAVLCLAVVGLGIFTDWFGLNGPLVQLNRAAKALVDDEGINCTIDARYTLAKTQIDMTIQMDIDKENKEIAALGESSFNDETIRVGIYDDQMITASSTDYSYAVPFETSAFWKSMDVSEGRSLLDIDAEYLVDMLEAADLYDEFIEYFDIDTFVSCLRTFVSHMNSSHWLEENAGYSKETKGDTTYYTYDLPIMDFARAVVDDFADAIIYQEDYDAVLKALNDEDLEDDISIVVRFGITGDVLSHIAFTISDGSQDIGIEMDIKDVGTTKVDTDLLAEMARDAEFLG